MSRTPKTGQHVSIPSRYGRKPKTRRHIARTSQKVYSAYRMTGSKQFDIVSYRFIVNTGKAYNLNEGGGLLGRNMPATANTRDIRGHGRTTSRCKRVQRQRWKDIAAVVEALPPLETKLPFLGPEIRMERSFVL